MHDTPKRPTVFGVGIDQTDGRARSVFVVDPELTASGNMVIRAGHEAAFGWERSEHIVLTTSEQGALLAEIMEAIVGGPRTMSALVLTEQERRVIGRALELTELVGDVIADNLDEEPLHKPTLAALRDKIGVVA